MIEIHKTYMDVFDRRLTVEAINTDHVWYRVNHWRKLYMLTLDDFKGIIKDVKA